MPYPAVRTGWADGDTVAAAKSTEVPSRRLLGGLPRVVGPLLGASVLGALILHLLADLVARLPASDALGALSVMVGMAVVLVTLLPFALLSVRRAQRAWAGLQSYGRGNGQGSGRS
ncbi:hypothetical protein TSH100_14300 [Azospirillum sp. TSH100]|uniref:hypothetical protein n=1 Tax=Azospirillum sp. TSH100 TaxID=652764 RepID=UPI000D60ED56|nr:hypothetical protein [Azospirillum sp. TSH100]PWC85753.1 hypothetical protein TSH100_14300 [Azospirillum sp. TSH100]QCG87802.1 hypothetical protein E6C72_08760 [Azospirillum sp. TSH100]